jgi:hypothetical protein
MCLIGLVFIALKKKIFMSNLEKKNLEKSFVRTLLTYTHLANRINSDNAPPSEKIREYLFIIFLYI